MRSSYRMLIAFVALVAATSFAEATCGDSGGPGYRGPNNKCVGGKLLAECADARPPRAALPRNLPRTPTTRRVRATTSKRTRNAGTMRYRGAVRTSDAIGCPRQGVRMPPQRLATYWCCGLCRLVPGECLLWRDCSFTRTAVPSSTGQNRKANRIE
jgi:hypothetical protein